MNKNQELPLALLAAAGRVERRLDASLSNIKGISFTEYQILGAIHTAEGGAVTRVDLAGDVGLTPSGVTRALRPLEKLGFLETTRDERDARRSKAALTSQGKELLGDATGVVDDALEQFASLSAASASDRRRLSELLDDLARS